MIRSRFGWAILFVLVALLGITWIAYSQVPQTEQGDIGAQTEAPIPGYLAPPFTLSTTLGESVNLSDYEGRPVVLNFWATWCPPCRAEIPHFQESSIKYNGRAAILGIDQGEPLPIVADFGSALGVTYLLLLDEDSDVNRQYAVSALPTTIFIDGQGIVREVYSGIVNRAVLEDRIEKLLAEG
jgi:cytochrome c biogenesis protein CcmG/thiol:disulfide interchange protein DsbE